MNVCCTPARDESGAEIGYIEAEPMEDGSLPLIVQDQNGSTWALVVEDLCAHVVCYVRRKCVQATLRVKT